MTKASWMDSWKPEPKPKRIAVNQIIEWWAWRPIFWSICLIMYCFLWYDVGWRANDAGGFLASLGIRTEEEVDNLVITIPQSSQSHPTRGWSVWNNTVPPDTIYSSAPDTIWIQVDSSGQMWLYGTPATPSKPLLDYPVEPDSSMKAEILDWLERTDPKGTRI